MPKFSNCPQPETGPAQKGLTYFGQGSAQFGGGVGAGGSGLTGEVASVADQMYTLQEIKVQRL